MTTKKDVDYVVEDKELHLWKKFAEQREAGVQSLEDSLVVEKEVLSMAQKKVSELQ